MKIIPQDVRVVTPKKSRFSPGALLGALVFVPWYYAINTVTWPMIIVAVLIMAVVDGMVYVARHI